MCQLACESPRCFCVMREKKLVLDPQRGPKLVCALGQVTLQCNLHTILLCLRKTCFIFPKSQAQSSSVFYFVVVVVAAAVVVISGGLRFNDPGCSPIKRTIVRSQHR